MSPAFADDASPVPGNPLIAIEGGTFIFGNDSGQENEKPRQKISIPPFAMNRTEVSNAQYQRFVAATGHRSTFYGGHPMLGLDDRPAVGLSWSDAEAFCKFYDLELPSEQQYERAARGKDGAPFPWGAEPLDPLRVNGGASECCSADKSDGYEMTAPVDSFAEGASPDGILNLVGNVWEWTRDFYAPYDGTPDPATAGKFRVLRGGAWNSDPIHLSTTYRLAYDPEFRFAANGGFRCVRDSQLPPLSQ